MDDLDAGFRVLPNVRHGPQWLWALFPSPAESSDAQLDAGLPIAAPGQAMRLDQWYRSTSRWSTGRYRRTQAWVRASARDHAAVFTAHLPSAGKWQLEYYLPGFDLPGAKPADYADRWLYGIEVVADETRAALTFDVEAAELGWNDLGTLDLPAGEVSVTVSNKGPDVVVVADAIRWKEE